MGLRWPRHRVHAKPVSPMVSQVPDFKGWFPEIEGFPRPDGKAIAEWIRQNVSSDRPEVAWQGIIREWLQRMRERLGKAYVVTESQHFHVLSELDAKKQKELLSFLEQTRARIVRQLGDISLAERPGKHVIMRFSDEDDYYRYTSYFDEEGEYAGSGGRFHGGDCAHIAFPHSDVIGADHSILIHELTHDLLESFPHPAWLGEALAMAFQGDGAQTGGPLVTRELADEHRAYWNPQTIQEFWQGISFGDVEGQKLAYNLASILLNLIATELRPPPAQFRDFVLHADRKDAGQSAALEHLDVDLSDLVATFLGPGEWAPQLS